MMIYIRCMMVAAGAIGMTATAGAMAEPVGPLQTTPAPSPAGHGLVIGFDLAGVRLRASPASVRSALAKAGYRVTYATDVASFAQQVASEAARRRGLRAPDVRDAGTGLIDAIGPHQEQVRIEFMQTPTGSEASNVSLTVPRESITGDALRRQLLERYGRPDSSRSGGSELAWCSPETMANCGRTIAVSGPLDDQHPLLTATIDPYGGGGRLRLQIGETAFPMLDAEREAAVQRLAPKTTSAAF